MHEEGAKVALSYASEALERRIRPLAESIGAAFVEKCDVTSDEEINSLFTKAESELGSIDILVHAIAFSNRGDFDKIAPLRERITKDDIGSAAAWLCSDRAAKTTGEVLYIDSGYNILGLSVPDDLM